MKSRLFSTFDPEADENRELKKDLRCLLGLSTTARETCIERLPELVLANTQAGARHVVQDLENAADITGLQAISVLQLGRFFLRAMLQESSRDDTTQAWADDLIRLDLLSRPESASLVDFVERIRRDVLPSTGSELRQREYATGVLPSLRSCGVTIELRGIIEGKFHWGNPVDEYRPNILGLVPVVSIHIGVDSGPQEDFFFQASKNDLQLLIDSLIAARTELESLEKHVQLRSE